MMLKVDIGAYRAMVERGGSWAIYRNEDMGHPNLGHLQFLKYGPGCTHETPPPQYHDTAHGLGWRYKLVGRIPLNGEDPNLRTLDVDLTEEECVT